MKSVAFYLIQNIQRGFVTKNFKKSPNLVALVILISYPVHEENVVLI